MVTEEQANGARVWRKIREDPDLINGILVGELQDLIELVGLVLSTPAIRAVPVAIVIRLAKADGDFDEQLQTTRELLNVTSIRESLTRYAEEVGA